MNNWLPILLVGGALYFANRSTATSGSPLSGDDARDALRLLKSRGAPPELLAYLAKHPALLREYMANGTINGKTPSASGTSTKGAKELEQLLAIAKRELENLKAKSGKGGGGGGGGGQPKGGASGKPKAPSVLGAPTEPRLTREQLNQAVAPFEANKSIFEKEVDLQFQRGNLTESQRDALLGEANATGKYDLGQIGIETYARADDLLATGQITPEQFNEIINGKDADGDVVTVDDTLYENAWNELATQESQDGEIDWDFIAEEMGWDTYPSDELEYLVDSWEASSPPEWEQFWEDWNAGEYDYTNEFSMPVDENSDWSELFPDISPDDYSFYGWDEYSVVETDDWSQFWSDYDQGYYDGNFGWTDSGYEDFWDAYDAGDINIDSNPDRRIALGNPVAVAAPAIGGLALFAIAAVTVLPEIIKAFKSTPSRRRR